MTESDKELLTVIIPCINEEESIALTVEDVLSYEEEIDVRLELLLIDDGSTDATLDVMRALAEEHSNVRVQVNERNLGVGRSVMNAYEQIDDASWITVVPGDNEFHFASIHKFLAVREDHDLVIGYLQNSVIRPAPQTPRISCFRDHRAICLRASLPESQWDETVQSLGLQGH